MTGWAQVNGLRGDTSITERTKYDLWYSENWSIWLDIKILIRTVWQIVFERGETSSDDESATNNADTATLESNQADTSANPTNGHENPISTAKRPTIPQSE